MVIIIENLMLTKINMYEVTILIHTCYEHIQIVASYPGSCVVGWRTAHMQPALSINIIDRAGFVPFERDRSYSYCLYLRHAILMI